MRCFCSKSCLWEGEETSVHSGRSWSYFCERLALTVLQGLDLLDSTFPIDWITINRLKLNEIVSFWSNVLPRTRKCQTWRKCTLQHNYTAAVADIHRQPLLFMNESRLAQTALRLLRVCSWKFSESHSSMHHEESSASLGPINCCSWLQPSRLGVRLSVYDFLKKFYDSCRKLREGLSSWLSYQEALFAVKTFTLRAKETKYDFKRQ